MAVHIIDLTEVLPLDRLSNSMSTQRAFDGQQLTVVWKNKVQTIPCKFGDRVKIICNGDVPEVKTMTPPSNPLAAAAWKHGFYKGTRYDDAKKMAEASREVLEYSVGHGCDMPVVSLYMSLSGNCVVCYKGSSTPWGWWANEKATPEEIEDLVVRHECSDFSLGISWEALVPEMVYLNKKLEARFGRPNRTHAGRTFPTFNWINCKEALPPIGVEVYVMEKRSNLGICHRTEADIKEGWVWVDFKTPRKYNDIEFWSEMMPF